MMALVEVEAVQSGVRCRIFAEHAVAMVHGVLVSV